MDNKARQLKSMFRQRAEQRGLPGGSSARPAKAARRDAPAFSGGASGSAPPLASRGGAGPPPGFFDADPPSRAGGGASAVSVAAAAPNANHAAGAHPGVPSGVFDGSKKPVAVASSRDAGEKNVLAMVMGPDSEDETPGEFIDQPPMGTSPTFDTVPGTTSLVMSHGGSNAADDDNARSKRKTQSLSVPDSFFDSATLAAAARGEKVVRLTPEETLASFEQSIEADIEEAKRQEQLEMENESVAKKEREAFQQKERVVGVSRLKEKAAAARRTGATRIATEKYPGTGHKKPTRPVDKNAGNNASVSTDSDSEDDDGLVLDWRAKKT